MASARATFLGLAVAALSLSSASAYTAAVVQHQVVTGATDAATIQLNLQKYQAAIMSATQQGAQIVVFPEFGLGMSTDNCTSTMDKTAFCEEIPYKTMTSPCELDTNKTTPIQTQVSCWAAQYNIHIGINTCESTPTGNYNTEIVFGPTGNYKASYRKMHPFFPSCFLTPPTPQLITFDAPVLNTTFGIFTCYDILFAAPAPELVAEGVNNFVYSAAIPVIGNEAQVLWSTSYHSTLLASNLQDGQSGIYISGTRVTPEPAAGEDVVLVGVVPV